MNRVVLTKEEGQWFSRNVIKSHSILLTGSQKDPKILERTTFKTLVAILPKAREIQSVLEQLKDEPFELDVILSDKQKLVIREMLKQTELALETWVLPKYQQQGKADYVADTLKKIKLLQTMARKFR